MKRKLTCTNYFILLEKKDFQESTPKTQMLMFRLAFYIYYVKYENTLTRKRISWDSWEMMF